MLKLNCEASTTMQIKYIIKNAKTKSGRQITARAFKACALWKQTISIYFSTEVDLRGDTLFPVDYGNGRVDPSRPFFSSLSLHLPACIPLLHGSAHPVLPWQQGLVRHGEDYGERKERKRGEEESTCSPLLAAESQRKSRRRGEETPQLPFSNKCICPSASTLTCPRVISSLISILRSFILPSSSSYCLHSLFPAIFALLAFFFSFPFPLFCYCLPSFLFHPWEWISNVIGPVHSSEGEL